MLKKRNQLVLIISLILIILVVILYFGVYNDEYINDSVESGEIDLIDSEQTVEEGEISKSFTGTVLEAYQKKDVSLCEQLEEDDMIISCKIQTVSFLDDFTCDDIKLYKNINFSYPKNQQNIDFETEFITLNSVDYCWIVSSVKKNINYCNKIKDIEGKEVCYQNLGIENE
jgi:hypothetical protein